MLSKNADNENENDYNTNARMTWNKAFCIILMTDRRLLNTGLEKEMTETEQYYT